jgi:hypothetical protein
VVVAKLLGVDINADLNTEAELNALLFKQLDTTVDYILGKLRVWNAEPEEPAGALVALEDGDPMAKAAKLLRDCKTGRARAYDGDLAAGLMRWRLGDDPPLVKPALHDR